MSRNNNYLNNRGAQGQGNGFNRQPANVQPVDTEFIDVLNKIRFADKLENLTDDKIFSNYPEELAKLVQAKKTTTTNNRTQIRKFYDELVMWDDKASLSEVEYAKNKVLLKMMKAKIAYAKGRKHIDDRFMKMFNQCMDQVTSAQKLRQFKLFFEAFMGYYRIEKSS